MLGDDGTIYSKTRIGPGSHKSTEPTVGPLRMGWLVAKVGG